MSAPTVAELAAVIRDLRALWRDHVRCAPGCPLAANPPKGPCTCRVGRVAKRADEILRRIPGSER